MYTNNKKEIIIKYLIFKGYRKLIQEQNKSMTKIQLKI